MTMHKIRQFASDNYSGVCPEAMEMMHRANTRHEASYGNDQWTSKACELFRKIFATDCDVFFVFNGTAANSLSLAALSASYHSIICHRLAHIETDECGAPQFFSNGTKILTGEGKDGKITAASVHDIATKRTDIHYPKPKVLSLTQATEVGTVYTPQEVRDLCAMARSLDMLVQMDGARLANALVTLDCSPADITWKAGIDVLCFGGTKNGAAIGDAVVFFNRDLAQEFDYRCKQAGQLCSKMRFMAAPWIGLLETGAWLKNAGRSNAMAEFLYQGLIKIPGVEILFPREANSVFVSFPAGVAEKLHDCGWHFYSFIGVQAARLMCSWDTTEQDVEDLVKDVAKAVG